MKPPTWQKCVAKTFFEDGGSIIPDYWWVVFEFAPDKGSPAVAYVPFEKDAGTIVDAFAAAERLRQATAALEWWFEPVSEADPITHLGALLSFLDAWDEAMKTSPGIQQELRAWRDRARAALDQLHQDARE